MNGLLKNRGMRTLTFVAFGKTVNKGPMVFTGTASASVNALLPGPVNEWLIKLYSLSSLDVGWDSYEAPPPSHLAISTAHGYLTTLALLRWEPSRVEASAMGGVGITHRQGTRKVYVEFYNDGRVHALLSNRTVNMQTMPVGADIQSFSRFIGRAREYLNA